MTNWPVTNWDDLRLFLAVARTGSISGAARLLAVQHSTVSRRIRQFEKQIGARLLDRKKTGYVLTREGRRVRQAAERMEAEILTVDSSLRDRDARLQGSLRVTAINNMASTILMPMFAAFSRAHPDVELHIEVSNLDASLPQREADIAIRLTNTPTETLIGTRVVTVASAVYGQRDYLDDCERRQRPPKWLGVNCCPFHRSWTRQSCGNGPHHFYSDDTLLTLAALREGLGVAWLPCFMGDDEPRLRRYTEPEAAHDLGLWLLIHPDLKNTARVIAFKQHMLAAIRARADCFAGRAPRADAPT